MSWIHDEARWMREYTRRWESLSFEELRAMLCDAEDAHDYRRALAIRRELDRRWRWIYSTVRGGDE